MRVNFYHLSIQSSEIQIFAVIFGSCVTQSPCFCQKSKRIVEFRAHRKVLIQEALYYDRINKGRVVYFFLFLLLLLDLPLLLLHALIFYVIYCSHLPKKSMTAIIQCHCSVVFSKYYLQFIVIVLLSFRSIFYALLKLQFDAKDRLKTHPEQIYKISPHIFHADKICSTTYACSYFIIW